jgi:PPOX class probable F420-dependent enzyme
MARKDISMTPEEVQEFLATNTVLQVATFGGDGWPHVAPLWYVMDGDKVVFRSFSKSQKLVNLKRNPRFTVLVETGDDYSQLQGVMIKAEARLVTDPDYVLSIYGGLAAKYPMINDTPMELDEDALQAAFGRFASKNTAVVVEPVKTITWDHTKLSGEY